jgi:hypothetical protein
MGSQDVVVPACVSAVLKADDGVRPYADVLLYIIFAIMKMRMSILAVM